MRRGDVSAIILNREDGNAYNEPRELHTHTPSSTWGRRSASRWHCQLGRVLRRSVSFVIRLVTVTHHFRMVQIPQAICLSIRVGVLSPVLSAQTYQ